uniref:CSON006761 protein n=1 Tax=Culicoides sonorensis TaxID=179676 RepID=A0A336MSX6_CULSO
MKTIDVVDLEKVANSHKNPFRTFEWREFACGWGAAFVNITATYPIYKVIFRQMLHGSTIRTAFRQIKGEGFFYLYRGMLPPLAQRTFSLSLMFGVYDGVKTPMINELHWNPYFSKILAGLFAGTVEAVLMPFERVQTILADAAYHEHYKNTPHAFRMIIAEHGFRELYRGIVPILWRNGPSNSLFFVMREEVNDILPHQSSQLRHSIQEFIAGACIGAFLSSLFYPINVLKVAMQSSVGGPSQKMLVVAKQIYVERGCKISNVYKGVSMNCTRAFFSWGIMNSAYEILKKLMF